jgi:hypothetical protein
MNLLKKITFNNKALQYIEQWLKNESGLSQIVLEQTDLQNGKVYTYVPESVDDEKLYQFNSGIYKMSKKDQEIKYKLPNNLIGALHEKGTIVNAEYWIVEDILEDFKKDFSNTCIVQDSVSAGILQYHKIEYASEYNNTLYSWIQKGMNKQKMFEIIHDTPNFRPPFIGFSFLEKNFELGKYPILSNEYFSTLSKCIHKIIVGAYDSESYLVWEKNK